jgi:hypothetical protein
MILRILRILNTECSTANNPSVALGGLVLNKGVTNKIFYAMLEVLLVVPNKNSGCIMTLDDDQPFFSLKDSAGNVIPRDDSPLNPGDYFIIAKGRNDHLSFVENQFMSRTFCNQ